MNDSPPTIAVIDWKIGPLGEKNCSEEKSVVGERARIHYQLAENIDDLDEISRSAQAQRRNSMP